MKWLVVFLLFPIFCRAEEDLLKDLLIVESINCCLYDHMPVTFNNFLQGGYINMPSARMGKEGEVGAGFSYVPPYRCYNLRLQYYDRIELSGNYRIFGGVSDPILSRSGFGDFSDKGVNIKLALIHPEETNYRLPGISIGWDDFLGTKSFQARYIVATQVFPQYNFEASLGWGEMRLNGWFGGISWMPFRGCNTFLHSAQLVAEYDAVDYKNKNVELHPKGRSTNSPFNVGVKYRLWNLLDLSAAYIRGKTFSFSASANYNLGSSKGIMPKVCDPLCYRTPVITEPLGPNRSEEMFVQDLFWAMRCQGFYLMEAAICGKTLYLRTLNQNWRCEADVRTRLNHLMAYLIPDNIEQVAVLLDGPGFTIQSYCFPMEYVRRYAKCRLCPYELKVLTPRTDARPIPYAAKNLFYEDRCRFSPAVWPKMITFFGSAKGKFKYALGVYGAADGYLFDSLWYSVQCSYTVNSSLYDVKDTDKLNPSQLINVRTDLVNYLKRDGVILEEAFVQKSCNFGCGYFGRFSGGLFELMYGGAAAEFLYYPANANFAFGIEGAWLKKRTYDGIGFTDKIRKLHQWQPSYVTFHGAQYFFNFYYDIQELALDVSVKAGKFLANDWGGRFEASRYYESGTRVYFWYTVTNGHDKVNGQTYFDKGVGISIPLDLFSRCSSRRKWDYGMAAWLRDVGQTAYTGGSLYHTIRSERERCLKK